MTIRNLLLILSSEEQLVLMFEALGN